MMRLGVAVMTMIFTTVVVGAQETSSSKGALLRFQQAVNDCVALHRRLEATLPPVEVSSDPEKIHETVDALAATIRTARPEVQQGNIFAAEIGELFRSRIQKTLREHRHEVADLLEAINAEVPPGANRPILNGRFPWARGAATWPCILNALPPLPEELQYRLVDRDLILVDVHADLGVDILPWAVPAK